MAVTSFPYTSVGGDRTITAFQEASGFNLFVSSGVVEATAGDLSTKLQVSAVPDTMQVSVAAGSAVIIGHRYIQTAAETLTLTAGGTLDRIDVIAVESNRENATRAAQLVVVEGEEAAEPVAPTLTTTDTVYQIPLAWVTVPGSATNLNSATITDKREASRPRGLSTEAQAVVDKAGYKLPVIVATTEAITLSGEQTIDEIAVTAGDRVLVKDQTDHSEDGIYLASANAWVRANDFDSNDDAVSQCLISVEQGTVNGTTTWRLTTASPIILGTTTLTWAQFDSDAQAGDGLTRVADTISMLTPGTITSTSTNAADGSGHTHAADSTLENPVYVYQCTGTGDDEAISDIVNAFMGATGDWTGTTARTLKLIISGTVGISAGYEAGNGDPHTPYAKFYFAADSGRAAWVDIDWSDARGIDLTQSTTDYKTFAMIYQAGPVRHKGLNMTITASGTDSGAVGIYATDDIVMEDCKIVSVGNDNLTAGMTRAVYLSGVDNATFERCAFTSSSTSRENFYGTNACLDSYFYDDPGSVCGSITIRDCTISAAITSGELAYDQTRACGARIRAKSFRCYNSTITGRAYDQTTDTDGPQAYGVYFYQPSATAVPSFCIIRDSVLVGYYRGGSIISSNRWGYGVGSNEAVDTMLIVEGNSFPLRALSNYTQTGAIKLEGSTEGAAYRIVGNVFAQADNTTTIAKHSDSSPAADYYVANNVFSRDLD